MCGVHSNFVGSWHKLALDLLPELFAPQAAASRPAVDSEKGEFYRQIGQMKVEMDFLKKTNGQVD
jgi:hypothetical protein